MCGASIEASNLNSRSGVAGIGDAESLPVAAESGSEEGRSSGRVGGAKYVSKGEIVGSARADQADAAQVIALRFGLGEGGDEQEGKSGVEAA